MAAAKPCALLLNTHSEIGYAVELLSDERVLDGHVAGVVVKRRCGEQDDERSDQRCDGVHPEEEPIQHHGDKTPIFILLLLKQKKNKVPSGMMVAQNEIITPHKLPDQRPTAAAKSKRLLGHPHHSQGVSAPL